MGKLITLINDVDVSQNFIALQGLESTGPDVIGSANLMLRKTGGGLDIQPGMTVEVYEAFNDAGAGVRERGRYFGGIVASVASTGELSSTFYTVNCVDNNVLLDSIVESVNNTLTVEADTFSAQILDIITTKQGVGGFLTRSIDAVSQVANLTGATVLPEVEFSHGETLREMIQKICDNAKVADPTIIPRFFMHVDVTFGIGDVVGAAVLYVYDGALTPSATFHFKSNIMVNSGSDRPIYGPFQYKLDAAPSLITKIQSYWHGADTASEEDAAAIAAFPNPYLASGAWLAKALVDTVSTTQAEADAQLQAILAQTSTPRRSITFISRQMVRPGEVVDVTWPMQGITAESYRVAGVSVLIPEGNSEAYCNITLDRMEMELGTPYVIGSSITTTGSGGGGGGGGTVTGITNPYDIETNTWVLTNAANQVIATFGQQFYGSVAVVSEDYDSTTIGFSTEGVLNSSGDTWWQVRGLDVTGRYTGDDPLGGIWGATISAVTWAGAAGDVERMTAIETIVNHGGEGTVTDLYGVYVEAPTTSPTGQITTAYGIYVEDQASEGNVGTAWAGYFNGDVNITGTLTVGGGGGGGGHSIEDEGVALTARAALNFTGQGATATDDAGNDATVIYIPRWEPAVNGDAAYPELLFDGAGEVLMMEVA